VRHPGQLTVSQASYRLIAAGGAELEAGSGEVEVSGGALELRPAGGSPLRVPFDRIGAVSEPQPYTIGVTLTDGTTIELSRLGTMRTQLLAELSDARAGVAAAASGAVGDASRFAGTTSGDPAEFHVFEDALIIMSASAATRISFSFIEGVASADYIVTVTLTGRPPLVVSRLGRRTDEFVTLLGERLREARTRTAAFLGSLLPGLDPMAQRAAAGLLRDGLAAPASALDAIHSDLSATLLRVAALPDRAEAVAALATSADIAIGFKQISTVRQAAVGGTPWHDPSVAPHIGQHESQGGLFRPGLAGAMAAGVMSGMGPAGAGGFGPAGFGPAGFGGGFPGGYGAGFGGFGGYGGGMGYGGPFGGGFGGGGFGSYWAYSALGTGMNAGGGQHQMTPRANVTRGNLTPSAEDLAALTTAGEQPTVLAFALIRSPRTGRVAYEVLNLPEQTTFVYEPDGQDGLDGCAAINRALDDVGFAAVALHAAASGDLAAAHRADAANSPLTRSLVGQLPHDDNWPGTVSALLAG
jgi:hypothetical protein